MNLYYTDNFVDNLMKCNVTANLTKKLKIFMKYLQVSPYSLVAEERQNMHFSLSLIRIHVNVPDCFIRPQFSFHDIFCL